MFNNPFVFDGKNITDKSTLALTLRRNFKKALSLIDDNSLMTFLEKGKNDLYLKIVDLSKEFECKENILTLIIYLLDNTQGINTPNYHFKSNYDISDVMKKKYPNIDPDIKRLFSDKVLAYIFKNEFVKTNDSRYKRNYTFMLHVYENRMYDFTYYYYLFLHLEKNETIRFTLDGIKMKSLAEISIHLSLNIDRASLIVEEILRNPFILALMAINSGIDVVAGILLADKKLEVLKCLSSYADVDLTPIIKRRMSFWLLSNYQNYNFETEEAKMLLVEYGKLNRNLSLTKISDYVDIYDTVDNLYRRFVSLFNHNKIVEFRNGITASEEYYLNYRFNDEYACKKFLVENNIYDEIIHTSVHNDTVEREILVDALEVEKKELIAFKEEITSLTLDLNFDKKGLRRKMFISVFYLFLTAASLLGGLLVDKALYDGEINGYIYKGLIILSSISIVLLLSSVVKYSCKLKDADLVEDSLHNCDVSLKVLEKEEELTLNPRAKNNYRTLSNLAQYHKNRSDDLMKIKKISKKKTSVGNFLIVLGSVLAILPILEFGLYTVLHLFNIEMYVIFLQNIRLSLISAGIFLLNTVLLIIFRKKCFAFYLVYLYIAVISVLSVLL